MPMVGVIWVLEAEPVKVSSSSSTVSWTVEIDTDLEVWPGVKVTFAVFAV